MEAGKKHNTYNILFHWHNFKMKLVLESIIVGALTGFIISLLRFLVDKSGEVISEVYKAIQANYFLIPIWVIVLILIGLSISFIVKKEPMISGGGIPQVEGVILRKLDMNWGRVLLTKFVGSVLAIGSGLSLGIEGPSVQLGAAVGQGFAKLSKRLKIEEKYLITSGASAGIAAAFNAPLAGAMFALEEIHKNLSPIILIPTLSAALSSDFVAGQFFGLKPVFDFRKISMIPLNYYPHIIILGIIVGIAGVGFNKGLLKTQKIYSMQKWLPAKFRPVLCLMFSVLIGLFLPQVLGEGNTLIMSLTKGGFAIKFLLFILVIKFLFSLMCGASGVPGGIFMPIFAIGALIGAIYGNTLTYFFHVNSIYIGSFIILAMEGYFSSTIKAPFTGSILVIEMTGSFSNLLPVAIMSIVAYVVTDLLNSDPIYETLLYKFLNKNEDFENINGKGIKSILEVPICLGASLAGKKIKDVKWPSHCLIVGVKRGDNEVLPKGDTVIYPGDALVILTDEYRLPKIQDTLTKMTSCSVNIPNIINK